MSRALFGELRNLNVRLAQFEDKYLSGSLEPDEKKFIMDSIAYYRSQIEKLRAQMPREEAP